MKKLIIMALTAGVAFCVWTRQSTRLAVIKAQNARLETIADELKQRVGRAESAKLAAEQHAAELRNQQATAQTIPVNTGMRSAKLPAPDPSHKGGWAQNDDFFYLPKQYLTNASFRLLDGDRLTEEAAALFGMSGREREATDKAFSDLLDEFHRLEIERMRSVPPPAGWVNVASAPGASWLQFDSALTYRIPDLSQDISSARNTFDTQLEQTLGPARTQLVTAAADSYLRQNMDDLGAGERIVGFVWQAERDGSHSLWYALADARHGEGSFQRVPENVEPHSQTAYYARLFGVSLPGQ